MDIPGDLLLVLWMFARGDTDPRELEQWLYADPNLEDVLGNSLYMAAIETDFGNHESVIQLRKRFLAFASNHDRSKCQCVRHPDVTIIDMGESEDFFAFLETTRERGQPYWWLFAADCSSCGQSWLIASEERQNDIYILRRLKPAESEAIVTENCWPSDFDRYETLLQIGKNAGRSVRFLDPLNSSLVYTVCDLAKARPGIRISELASLLNVSNDLAVALAQRAAKNESLDIIVDVATQAQQTDHSGGDISDVAILGDAFPSLVRELSQGLLNLGRWILAEQVKQAVIDRVTFDEAANQGYIFVRPSPDLNAKQTIIGVFDGETIYVGTQYAIYIDTDNWGRLVGITVRAPGEIKIGLMQRVVS